jgi:hypothetical protein
MGWLWASQRPQGNDSASAAPIPPPQPKTDSSDAIDPEVQKFIALFQEELGQKDSEKSTPPQATQETAHKPGAPQSSSSTWSWVMGRSSSTAPPTPRNQSKLPLKDEPDMPELNELAESLLPTTMSCRQAWDLAYGCQSISGQVRSIYRYGAWRECSELWDDFWFCMRLKSYNGKVKEDLIRAHYRQKERNKYGDGKPSSEDVWEARTEPVPLGTAFKGLHPRPELNDQEWQAAEIERRKRIRGDLDVKS